MSFGKKIVSLAEYEANERIAEFKSEYFRGEIFAMTGGTPTHSLIAANFIGEARQLLKDRACSVFTADLRIKLEPSGLYTYPDASIVCGELQFAPNISDTVTNPIVIVEVLSDSTEKFDRGRKASYYRQMSSLRELLLIELDRPHIERFIRQPNGYWLLSETSSIDKALSLESVAISIPLAEIYRGVTFEA